MSALPTRTGLPAWHWRTSLPALAITALILLVLPWLDLLTPPPPPELTVRPVATILQTMPPALVPASPAAVADPVTLPAAAVPPPLAMPPVPNELPQEQSTSNQLIPSPRLQLADLAVPKLPRLELQLDTRLDFAQQPTMSPLDQPSAPADRITPAALPATPGRHLPMLLPEPRRQPAPVYPYKAQVRQIEGYVDVRFTVDQQGSVTNIGIVRSVPDQLFVDSVLAALAHWTFRPAQQADEQAVPCVLETRIWFKLE